MAALENSLNDSLGQNEEPQSPILAHNRYVPGNIRETVGQSDIFDVADEDQSVPDCNKITCNEGEVENVPTAEDSMVSIVPKTPKSAKHNIYCEEKSHFIFDMQEIVPPSPTDGLVPTTPCYTPFHTPVVTPQTKSSKTLPNRIKKFLPAYSHSEKPKRLKHSRSCINPKKIKHLLKSRKYEMNVQDGRNVCQALKSTPINKLNTSELPKAKGDEGYYRKTQALRNVTSSIINAYSPFKKNSYNLTEKYHTDPITTKNLQQHNKPDFASQTRASIDSVQQGNTILNMCMGPCGDQITHLSTDANESFEMFD